MEANITEITTLAGVVAAEHAASVEAHQAVTEAEADLLARVVEAVKPALRAVSSRRRVTERTFWPDRVCTETVYTAGPLALRVYGSGPTEDYPRANRGSIEGTDLYLNPDGTWTEATYSGSWTRWQGESSSRDATDKALTVREVADAYGVDDIFAAIGEALSKAKGTRDKPTAKALERAERVRAVACLVK
jgi:hypothetical protein